MTKINVAPEIKKEYNRARKSLQQKIRRAEQRGYEFYDYNIKSLNVPLSKFVSRLEDKSQAEIESKIREQTSSIKYHRENLYESNDVEYVDPATGLRFYGYIGEEIEKRRNKAKFRGEYRKEDLRLGGKQYSSEYSRIFNSSLDWRESEEFRISSDYRKQYGDEEWRREIDDYIKRHPDIKISILGEVFTSSELEDYLKTQRKDYDEEYDPSEFYSDRDDRGTGEPPSEVDSAIDNVQDELKRWTTDANKKYEEEQAEGSLQDVEGDINEWTPQANWTPTLEECKRRDIDTVENVLISAINDYGREAIAWNIQRNASRVTSLLQSILYASGSKEGNFKDGRTQVNADIVEFKELITGHKLTLEESERYTRMAERNELNE